MIESNDLNFLIRRIKLNFQITFDCFGNFSSHKYEFKPFRINFEKCGIGPYHHLL